MAGRGVKQTTWFPKILLQMSLSYSKSLLSFGRSQFSLLTFSRWKHVIDKSRVPSIREEDIEEEFVRGSGPGGQAVSKTSNCVVLHHKPTGIVIKSHQTRSLEQNRVLAREVLLTKLDNMINGDMSVEAQERRVAEKKSRDSSRKHKKLTEMKKAWKEREGLE